MNVYQDGDRVCLDLGDEKREVLLAVAIADLCADAMGAYAGRALVSAFVGHRDREPSVEVESVRNRGKAMVRIRFSWFASKFFLTAAQSIALAETIRAASRLAERSLRWQEERDPAVLLR